MKNSSESPRHFLDIGDLTRPELETVLMQAMEFRRQVLSNLRSGPRLLDRQVVASISSKPSTRTRGAIAAAAAHLGGASESFPSDSLFDKDGKPREPLRDIAMCLEAQGFPIAFARLNDHKGLHEMTQGRTSMSIVNALTDDSHPLQALADVESVLLTRSKVARPKIVFAGDGNNVCVSLGEASATLGWDFVHTGPQEYRVNPTRWAGMQRMASTYDGSVTYNPQIEDAVAGATMVYTDKFLSMGQDPGEMEKRKYLLKPYQVNGHIMDHAPDAVVSHCLPAARGMEITSDVIDGPQSIASTTAGCRTDTTVAIMKLLLKQPSWLAKLDDWFNRIAIGPDTLRPLALRNGQTARMEEARVHALISTFSNSSF